MIKKFINKIGNLFGYEHCLFCKIKKIFNKT